MSNHFGTINSALAPTDLPAFDLDLGAHEYLRSRLNDDGAKTKRPGETHGSFEKRDIPHGETHRHRYTFNPARFA